MLSIHIPYFAYKKESILENLAINFEVGQTHGIVGLNGAGKTTFFNLVAGHLNSEECRISFNSHTLKRSSLAFLDTDLFLYPKLTGREFLSVFKTGSSTYNENELATLFKLPLDELAETYSTGMKKKLLLQSQIKQDKAVYILDEPFNGLDLETNQLLTLIIKLLNERGKTVLISSHILDPLYEVCSHIHHLKNKGFAKSYTRNEFESIHDDLFGRYLREAEEGLRGAV